MSGSISMSATHVYKHCDRYQCLYHRNSAYIDVPLHRESCVNASSFVTFLAHFGINEACSIGLLLCQICPGM